MEYLATLFSSDENDDDDESSTSIGINKNEAIRELSNDDSNNAVLIPSDTDKDTDIDNNDDDKNDYFDLTDLDMLQLLPALKDLASKLSQWKEINEFSPVMVTVAKAKQSMWKKAQQEIELVKKMCMNWFYLATHPTRLLSLSTKYARFFWEVQVYFVIFLLAPLHYKRRIFVFFINVRRIK